MKKIIAINASPRTNWNTAQLVHAAAEGAEKAGAEVEIIDLYSLEPFMGCRSCFACMTDKSYGKCAEKDGLYETLEKIRESDGLIIGTPNYFSRPTAGFRALYERLCFQHLTYQMEQLSSNEHSVPVLLIMTSNAAKEAYAEIGYVAMLDELKGTLETFVGPVTIFTAGETLQTNNYEKFKWDIFDVPARRKRHDEVFPKELDKIRELAEGLF